MAIEVGKDVVAIVSHSEGDFKKGQIFTCLGLRASKCKCIEPEINIGFRSYAETQSCDVCNIYSPAEIFAWYSIECFRALDDITPSIEEIIKEIAPLKLINH